MNNEDITENQRHARCAAMASQRRVNNATRIIQAVAAGMLTVFLAGCGQTLHTAELPTVTPTTAPAATATPTAIPTATATVLANATCHPDPYGIYAEQTTYVTSLTDAPFTAPPRTKHGIGSAGVNGQLMQGGESGVCSVGTAASVNSFYTNLLPTLGWQYVAPPAVLAPCFHGTSPARAWWKGTNTFEWFIDGNAGGDSVFWSYTYCSIQA